jgi:hypothetical protein
LGGEGVKSAGVKSEVESEKSGVRVKRGRESEERERE